MNEKSVAFIDRKFIEYEFQEQRLLTLQNPLTGGLLLRQNQPLYFGANAKLKGKRLVGIEVMANALPVFIINGVSIVPTNNLPEFTITIRDNKGNDCIKQYPITDLHRSQHFGKQRIFNVEDVDIENSFIVATEQLTFVTPFALLFQFFTVSW